MSETLTFGDVLGGLASAFENGAAMSFWETRGSGSVLHYIERTKGDVLAPPADVPWSSVSDLGVWTRRLTEVERAQLAGGYGAGHVAQDALVAWLPLYRVV